MFIVKTEAQKIAERIDSMNEETVNFLRAQLKESFRLANTAGEEQAIMDAFGTNAVSALTIYQQIYGALEAIGRADGLTNANTEIFVPQPDGSVTYVAPAE